MIPLVACPYCTRMIKLRRRNCNRKFVHSECGATVQVPRAGYVRKGSPLELVSPPENSFETAMEPLPDGDKIEQGAVPREVRDRPETATKGSPKNPASKASPADLADLTAKLQELTIGLAEVAARLQELSGVASNGGGHTSDEMRNSWHGTEQATHARLVKGKANSASLREIYRPLEDVDELRKDNVEAQALKESNGKNPGS